MYAARVEEVLGDFINIKRRGSNLMANCPFHDEKTPSFVVSPAKGIYKCFGCGKSGNSITFLMEHENLAYADAIRYLARKYNIEIVETVKTADEIQKGQERDSLFIVNEYAQKVFQKQLTETVEGKTIALAYFKERGFTDKTIEDFGLGYCLDQKDHFSLHAIAAGYREDFLVQLGLTKKREDGSYYDFFKGRILFPIHNLTGKVIGFGGRVMSQTEKTAKYINSPENEIYQKSKVLYGMHLAKKAIPKDNYCLLVEGYTDVISLHQAGIENVVASSGTALTEDQLKLIRRFTENLYILYDGDKAGINAALRGTDLALQTGLNVKLSLLPEGNDPDSYVKTHGGQQLKLHIVEKSQDIVTFRASLYKEEAGSDPIKKAELTRSIVQTISLISDSIKRSFYIKECALLMSIDEEILVRETQKIIVDRRKKAQYSPESDRIPVLERESPSELYDEYKRIDEYNSSLVIIEKELCKVLIEHGSKPVEEKRDDDNPFYDETTVASYIFTKYLINFQFESQICEKIFKYIKDSYDKGSIYPVEHFLSNADQEISAFAIAHCQKDLEQLHDWKRHNKTLQIVAYGQKYHSEIDQILQQIRISYFEKLSKQLMDMTKEAIGSETTLTENALKHLEIQREFLSRFKDELSNDVQYIFRKQIR